MPIFVRIPNKKYIIKENEESPANTGNTIIKLNYLENIKLLNNNP